MNDMHVLRHPGGHSRPWVCGCAILGRHGEIADSIHTRMIRFQKMSEGGFYTDPAAALDSATVCPEEQHRTEMSPMNIIGHTPEGIEIAGWLLKGDPKVFDVDAELDTDGVIQNWSVHDNYRAHLMADGQRCVLWRSGPNAGVIAAGYVTGPVEPGESDPASWVDQDKAREAKLFVPVELYALDAEIQRADFKTHPVLSQVEVLRSPQGSNPSILTPEELDALEELLAEVEPHDDSMLALVDVADARFAITLTEVAEEFALLREEEDGEFVETARHDSALEALLAALVAAKPQIDALPPADLEAGANPIVIVDLDNGADLSVFKVDQGFWAFEIAGSDHELVGTDDDLAALLVALLGDDDTSPTIS